MRKTKLQKKYEELPIQVRASFWFLLCSFFQKGISVITTPIFTRLMNTAEYGEFNVFISWYNIIAVIVTLVLYSGCFTQGLVKFKEERHIFASSLQGLSISLVVIWTILYLLFHRTVNSFLSLTTVQVLAMLAMIWASAAFNFWATSERVELKYKHLVILTIIVSVTKPLLGIILVVFAKDKVTARIIGLALIEIIAYSGLFVAQLMRGKVFISKKYWKYALAFNIPLVPHYLSQMVLNGADRIMIRNYCGASEAGIYGLAYSIALIMTLFNTALLQTVEPWLYEKIKDKKLNDIGRVAYPTLIIICVANLVLIAFAPEIVSVFAPKTYHDAIWIIPPVAMSVFFMFAYGLFATFEFYYEKTKHIAAATLLVALANIALNYYFIIRFGYIAAGYTTLLCYMLYALFHYLVMTSICKTYFNKMKAYNGKVLILITLLFLLLGSVFTVSYLNNMVRWILILLLSALLLYNFKKVKSIIVDILKVRNKQ